LERGGLNSSTGTSGPAALHWLFSQAACYSLHLARSGELAVRGEIAWDLITRPPCTALFQPESSLFCSGDSLVEPLLVPPDACWHRPFCLARFAAAAFAPFHSLTPRKFALWFPPLLLWGDTLPSLIVFHVPSSITPVTLRVPKALAAHAL
jgi:hypothetical protein